MLLLDTCALLWLAHSPMNLSEQARKAIVDNAGGIFVSAISIWEVTLKHRSGRLGLPADPKHWYSTVLEHHGIAELPVTGAVAIRSANLPNIHRDPADRFVIATALENRLRVVTPDPHIRDYPDVSFVW